MLNNKKKLIETLADASVPKQCSDSELRTNWVGCEKAVWKTVSGISRRLTGTFVSCFLNNSARHQKDFRPTVLVGCMCLLPFVTLAIKNAHIK